MLPPFASKQTFARIDFLRQDRRLVDEKGTHNVKLLPKTRQNAIVPHTGARVTEQKACMLTFASASGWRTCCSLLSIYRSIICQDGLSYYSYYLTLLNSQIHQITNLQTYKLTDSPTHQLTNLSVPRLINAQTHKLISSQTHHLTNPQTHKLTNSSTHQPINSPTHQLTNSPTHQLTNS